MHILDVLAFADMETQCVYANDDQDELLSRIIASTKSFVKYMSSNQPSCLNFQNTLKILCKLLMMTSSNGNIAV